LRFFAVKFNPYRLKNPNSRCVVLLGIGLPKHDITPTTLCRKLHAWQSVNCYWVCQISVYLEKLMLYQAIIRKT